mmetsp:Transcript_11999/g.17371  ORF Transcript_11999/g.17371 Transcript_11999/m.17371 type:complete len:119 (-) Transcript_11999:97-453(-)|eukprot:CAMPEP_0195511114 /NCGR_PEP_ID=MMETSP0794_2-20130614/3557_1 /TAXON_ID=515487 /ORGANISM="Stephanopyxis turris, Strain CCMP 815" /LENGTH=118 /DNA_ID=CAMNT_0040638661 /DNA_START=159 /DNA_END=515 /DNA_ORIENTATION=+
MSNKGPSEVQLALNDVMSLNGMKRYLIINEDGVPLKWYGPPSFTYTEVVRCAAHFLHFARKAQQYYEESLVPGQSLTTIRLRTKDNDIMIAPGEHVIFIAFQEVSQPDAKEDEAKKEE